MSFDVGKLCEFVIYICASGLDCSLWRKKLVFLDNCGGTESDKIVKTKTDSVIIKFLIIDYKISKGIIRML